MISAVDLVNSTFDSVAITSEGLEGEDVLRAAGVDPTGAVMTAKMVTPTYAEHIRFLQLEEGMDYHAALVATLAACWLEGVIAGVRAARAEDADE